jgi:hypothetical protein
VIGSGHVLVVQAKKLRSYNPGWQREDEDPEIDPRIDPTDVRNDRRKQEPERESQQISGEQEAPNKPTAALGPTYLAATLEHLERSLVNRPHESLFETPVGVSV